MRRPASEHEVDAALVASLLADQHPELASLEVTFLAEGWDTSSWRVGDGLLARLPRREVVVPGLLAEQRWLPRLAPMLPVPVPAPVRVGAPGRGFPWPWSVVPYLDGTPALDGAQIHATRLAGSLSAFLRALHVPAPTDAPTSEIRGVPLAQRAAGFDALCAELAGRADVAVARRAFDRALRAAPQATPVWVHGDPHPGNLLIADGDLVGVLDFIDLCAGDPATDLAGAWMLLDGVHALLLLERYGADDALRARARGWAALFALLFSSIGTEHDPAYGAIGAHALASLRAGDPDAVGG